MRFFVLAGLVLWPAFALAQPEGPAGTPSPVNPEPEEPAPPEPPTSNAPGQPLPVGEGEGEGASEGHGRCRAGDGSAGPAAGEGRGRGQGESRRGRGRGRAELGLHGHPPSRSPARTRTCSATRRCCRRPLGFAAGGRTPWACCSSTTTTRAFSGYETLSHLALYRRHDGERLVAEAGFIIRMNELAGDNIRLSDGGSYIRVA